MACEWKASYDDGRKIKLGKANLAGCRKHRTEVKNAFCKLCHSLIKPKQSKLKNHEKSDKHSQRVKALTTVKPMCETRRPPTKKNYRNRASCDYGVPFFNSNRGSSWGRLSLAIRLDVYLRTLRYIVRNARKFLPMQ